VQQLRAGYIVRPGQCFTLHASKDGTDQTRLMVEYDDDAPPTPFQIAENARPCGLLDLLKGLTKSRSYEADCYCGSGAGEL